MNLSRTVHALVVVALALPPAIAQTPAAAPAPIPAAQLAATRSTVPSDGNAIARPAEYAACRARVAAAVGHPVDILFVGDSITQAWTSPPPQGLAMWDRYYATRNALNFGVGGDRTEDVLWRLDNMNVAGFRPKAIVLLIGTNNVDDTPAQVAAGVRAVLDKLAAMYPGAKTVLVSILPNARRTQLATDTNAIVRGFADGHSVYYLDVVPLMPMVGDNWVGMGPDRLHPVEAGYQIWATAMEPLIEALGIPAVTPVSSAPSDR